MISILTTARNNAKYINDCIESVANQTYIDWELIINDYSDDGTADLVEEYQNSNRDLKITYITNSTTNVNEARNQAAALAKGEYLCYLDADDTLEPRFLEIHRYLLSQFPHRGFIYSKFNFKNMHAKHIDMTDNAFNRFPYIEDKYKANPYIGNTFLMTREAFDTVGGCDESMPGNYDMDLVTMLIRANYIPMFIDEPLWNVRLHPMQITNVLGTDETRHHRKLLREKHKGFLYE